MYLGGITPSNYFKSAARWGTAVPAVNQKDPHLTDEFLAADTVFFTGGPSYQWDAATDRYQINHPRRTDNKIPDFQNILYGDGHVEGKGREWYPSALTTSNYSLCHAGSGIGGFMYWGPTLSSRPWGSTLPPPAAPSRPPRPRPLPPRRPRPHPRPHLRPPPRRNRRRRPRRRRHPILPKPIPSGPGE